MGINYDVNAAGRIIFFLYSFQKKTIILYINVLSFIKKSRIPNGMWVFEH